jgi:hypothetical protein
MHVYLKDLPNDAEMVQRLRLERTVTSALNAYEEANPQAHSEIIEKLLGILEVGGTQMNIAGQSQNEEVIAIPMPLSGVSFASGSK